MTIQVNGEATTVNGATVAELLEQFGLAPRRVAVEVNEELVKRAQYVETALKDGDRVEIVTLVGGG